MGYKLYQLKLHQATDVRLHQALSACLATHTAEVNEVIAEKHRTTDKTKLEKLEAKLDELIYRGRKITIHNLIRIVLENGMPSVTNPKNGLGLLSKYGTPIGRRLA